MFLQGLTPCGIRAQNPRRPKAKIGLLFPSRKLFFHDR